MALAAGIFLPLLVALYMLRLRRERRTVASTLLWRSAYEDLLANVPIQRLRWSILLLLQIIALLLVAAALARPTGASSVALGARTIVLLDVGASMRIVSDAGRDATRETTRLDLALAEVEAMIRAKPADAQMMLLGFGASPTVICGWDRNPNVLRSTLRSFVESQGATDEPSDLDAAMLVAESFSRPSEAGDDIPAMIVIVSDGHVRTARDERRFEIAAGAMREVRIDEGDVDNVGIVEFDARRREDDPTQVELFARVIWTGSEELSVPMVVEVDGEVVRRRNLLLPASSDDAFGEAALSETIDVVDSALLVVRHTHLDPFAADDVVAAVLPPPRQLRIAMVAPDARPDAFLRDLLNETDPQELETLDPAGWLAVDRPADRFDLVVFDRVDAEEWPVIPSISFGAAPPGVERVIPTGDRAASGRRLLGWNRQHPLLRHADIADLVFAGVAGLRVPEEAEAVALGPDGPVIILIRVFGIRHIVVAFSLLESTLPVLPGYPVFVQNALDLLAGEAGAAAIVPRTGEPTRLRVRPGTERLFVSEFDENASTERRVNIPAGGVEAVIPTAQQIGLRRVRSEPPDQIDLPGGLLPASLLSESESDLRRQPPLTLIPTAAPPGGEGVIGRAEWWHLALLAALGILVVEWIVYMRRAGS